MRSLSIFGIFTLAILITHPVQAASPIPQTIPTWMSWTADHYTLAEDTDAIWIGTGGGLVRYDKATGTHTRITVLDGLPHRHVYAAAVDSAGNRWFGGDAGLSWLDLEEGWHHETPFNSSLAHPQITDITLGADGTLWAGHGDSGGVSRRSTDGDWAWFPHATVAVVADYTAILQTQNSTHLWTVRGQEVWVGYAVYDGNRWIDRTPPAAQGNIVDAVVAGTGALWVLDDSPTIYWWDGQAWRTYSHEKLFSASALAVDAVGTLWIAWGYQSAGVFTYCAGYGRLFESPPAEFCQLSPHPPVIDLLAGGNGMWVLGEGWFSGPNDQVYLFADIPPRHRLETLFTSQAGDLWIFSTDQPSTSYPTRWLHTFDDGGTTAVEDDQLQEQLSVWNRFVRLTTDTGGDFWVTWQNSDMPPLTYNVSRRHGDQWLSYSFDEASLREPIYAQDEQRIWFLNRSSTLADSALYLLDDQGTPALVGDDSWTRYTLPTTVEGKVVVDRQGRLWYGADKLYRYTGTEWQVIYDKAYGVEDLLAAPSGEVVAIFDEGTALLVAEDDTYQTSSVQELIETRSDWLHDLDGYSRYWRTAPDGSLWYLLPFSYSTHHTLHHIVNGNIDRFELPFPLFDHIALTIDKDNHLWFVSNNTTVWRFAIESDFGLYLPVVNRGFPILTGDK